MSATIDDLPIDESGDAAVLAQAKRAYEEHLASQKLIEQQAQAEYHAKCEPVVDSLFKFAELRHKAREKLIAEGRLVDVLRSDAALEGNVSDAESIVEATLLKAGVEEPIADLTMTMVSTIGRMFLGLGPSYRDMIKTTRNLYGDERTPERKAADKARLLEKLDRYKVKAKEKVEEVSTLPIAEAFSEIGRLTSRPQVNGNPSADTCPWCGGPADTQRCCEGDNGDGECPGSLITCRNWRCRWGGYQCSTLAVEYSGRDAEGTEEAERCSPENCDKRGAVQPCASGWDEMIRTSEDLLAQFPQAPMLRRFKPPTHKPRRPAMRVESIYTVLGSGCVWLADIPRRWPNLRSRGGW